MIKQIYALMCDNYNRPKTKEHYEMFKDTFQDEDEVYLLKAIKKIIREEKYMPNIARIREVLNEVYQEPLTQEEKLARWKKEGIVPSCLSKEPSEEEMSEEELKELEAWKLLFQ